MTRLTALTPAQIRMMTRMAGRVEAKDAVGMEAGSLSGHWRRVADSLVVLRLAEIRPGWRNTYWYALTDEGRKVRDTGKL